MEHPKLIRILSVEDHPVFREGLSTILGSQPDMLLVAQATNGVEAMEEFRRYRPDITLMDLRLPGTNGTETLIAMRGEFPHARIIVLTTSDGDGEIQRALRAGASANILKSMPSVMYGGLTLLDMLMGNTPGYSDNPLRQNLWRAGHAHARCLPCPIAGHASLCGRGGAFALLEVACSIGGTDRRTSDSRRVLSVSRLPNGYTAERLDQSGIHWRAISRCGCFKPWSRSDSRRTRYRTEI
jgi:CheY-like chemotaxis protein